MAHGHVSILRYRLDQTGSRVISDLGLHRSSRPAHHVQTTTTTFPAVDSAQGQEGCNYGDIDHNPSGALWKLNDFKPAHELHVHSICISTASNWILDRFPSSFRRTNTYAKSAFAHRLAAVPAKSSLCLSATCFHAIVRRNHVGLPTRTGSPDCRESLQHVAGGTTLLRVLRRSRSQSWSKTQR